MIPRDDFHGIQPSYCLQPQVSPPIAPCSQSAEKPFWQTYDFVAICPSAAAAVWKSWGYLEE